MVTASELAARFLLLASTGLFSSVLFLFLLFAAKQCCLRWRPGRKRSKSPLIWWGQNKRSPKGVCLNGCRYFGGEPTKQKPCFFVVVDPCLDQGSLNMSTLGGWSKLMLMPMYGLESLYNDPLLIYTPNFIRSTLMFWNDVLKASYSLLLCLLKQDGFQNPSSNFAAKIFEGFLFRIRLSRVTVQNRFCLNPSKSLNRFEAMSFLPQPAHNPLMVTLNDGHIPSLCPLDGFYHHRK